MKFTISILTYNRKDVVAELLSQLQGIKKKDLEIIVVDNCSTDGTTEMIRRSFPSVRLIVLPRNIGVDGRNFGIVNARGEILVTIDDDIMGIDDYCLDILEKQFGSCSDLAAINFQVKDYYSGEVCNWCHPYAVEEFADKELETVEISEGAVAFRRDIFSKTGLYPHMFFISHEGADLCARILDKGYKIAYTPHIVVKHKYSREGRKNWRRYYYDTRNDFWLVIRNYRLSYGIQYLLRRSISMMVYSLRDGFFRYWLKAVVDVLIELPAILKQRKPVSKHTEERIRFINANRPGFMYYLNKRLKQKQVRI